MREKHKMNNFSCLNIRLTQQCGFKMDTVMTAIVFSALYAYKVLHISGFLRVDGGLISVSSGLKDLQIIAQKFLHIAMVL